MAVICRQEFFAFCRAESFTRWPDYYCYLYNNKRKKIDTFTQHCHKSNVFNKRDAAFPCVLCAMLQVSYYK